MQTKEVSKGVLKAKMLEYFREVEETGQELIVTDHRRPTLKVIPLKTTNQRAQDIFGIYRGQVKYFEDINTPTLDEWREV